MKKFLFAFLTLFTPLFAADRNPFSYDLHLTEVKGNKEGVMICFHGMGSDYTICQMVKACAPIEKTIVGFNFPDYNFYEVPFDPTKVAYGTFQEVLPALFVLKRYSVEKKVKVIDLYGFSAGGGAIINTLAALNSHRFDQELQSIGIGDKEKKTILKAIERGVVILDVPLKSVSEIIDYRGHSQELDAIGKHYAENKMEPIDSLQYLQGLSLHVIVFFQTPDLILSNRDDALYIERLKKYNAKGTTVALYGNDGAHAGCHRTLWNYVSSH